MKKALLAALLAVIAGGSLAARVRADDEPGMGPSPHEMQWDKMKSKLGLSDEQVAKLKDTHKSMEEAMKPLHEKMKADVKKLKEQVNAKASDADLKATMDALRQDRKDAEAQMDKHHDDMSSILTPTQHAKMMLEMHERMEGHEHGMKHKDGKKDGDAR